MTHQQVLKDLKNKVYHPIYFLSGEETYHIDLIAKYIEEHVLNETEKDFNQSVLYGKDVNMTTILGEAKRYPMMASHSVVIVKEAQHLTRELDKLEPYLDNPNQSTLLVFCYKNKTLDGRKNITKKLKKNAIYLESKRLYDNQVPDWIVNYLKEKGYQITPPATALITEFLGADLGKIANELDKLTLNIAPEETINPAMVEQYIGISKDFNNYELNKALGTRNRLKTIQITDHFAKNEKNHPLVVTIAVLYGFFSNILKYHYLQNKSDTTVAAALKINPFFVQEYKTAANNYSIRACVNTIAHLRTYDLKVKGVDNTSTSSGELLREMVLKILY